MDFEHLIFLSESVCGKIQIQQASGCGKGTDDMVSGKEIIFCWGFSFSDSKIMNGLILIYLLPPSNSQSLKYKHISSSSFILLSYLVFKIEKIVIDVLLCLLYLCNVPTILKSEQRLVDISEGYAKNYQPLGIPVNCLYRLSTVVLIFWIDFDFLVLSSL